MLVSGGSTRPLATHYSVWKNWGVSNSSDSSDTSSNNDNSSNSNSSSSSNKSSKTNDNNNNSNDNCRWGPAGALTGVSPCRVYYLSLYV